MTILMPQMGDFLSLVLSKPRSHEIIVAYNVEGGNKASALCR
jgi:hypothetical protein